MNKYNFAIGDKYTTNNYGVLTIIGHVNGEDVCVRFEHTGYETLAKSYNILKGEVRDPFYPILFDVGYMGDCKIIKGESRSYTAWYNILRRCYCKTDARYPNYGGVGVRIDDEWHNFSNFKIWFEQFVPEGYDIDKDLLDVDAKIYSESTCVALPHYVNMAITGKSRRVTKLPTGVTERRSRFIARVGMNSEYKWLGAFNTPEEAHQAYRKAKTKYVHKLAQESYNKGEITERVYEALLKWSPPDETKETN